MTYIVCLLVLAQKVRSLTTDCQLFILSRDNHKIAKQYITR